MITHTPLVAGNLPIKTLVARRWPTTMDVPVTRGIHYQTCKAEYHLLSRQRITVVQYLALTSHDILPCRLDNIIKLTILFGAWLKH